ncbi:hypothetical protein TorRG33x02_333130, partial [Trema orientale]
KISYNDFALFSIPNENSGATLVGRVVGSYAAWPKVLVIFNDESVKKHPNPRQASQLQGPLTQPKGPSKSRGKEPLTQTQPDSELSSIPFLLSYLLKIAENWSDYAYVKFSIGEQVFGVSFVLPIFQEDII